ncbi:MAG TPA: DUF1844 domain-containing protein [Nitrospirota bacterium]|nr:DUF1844 domain-containing protein [Nitrospirota bacterium]
MAENKDDEFTIRDRRGSSPPAPDASGEQQKEEKAPPKEQPSGQRQESGPLPPLDFSTFILSLATTAQMGLGLVPDPQSRVITPNLPVAKQMIDLIGMLKEKTKNNLSGEEQELLESVLAGLRITYVKVLEGKK